MFKIIDTKMINKEPVLSIVDTSDYTVENVDITELKEFLYKGMIIEGATLLPNGNVEIHIQSPAVPNKVQGYLKSNLSKLQYRRMIILLWHIERLGCNLLRYESVLISTGNILTYIEQTIRDTLGNNYNASMEISECNSILMEG